jgi:hypothetical protein
MSQREIAGAAAGQGFVSRLLATGGSDVGTPVEDLDLGDYLRRAIAGGYPQAILHTPESLRTRWYTSYLEQVLTADLARIGGGDPARLRRYLDACASALAAVPATATLAEAAAVDVGTATRYDELLLSLGVLDVVPAWTANRLKRLTRRGKRFLTDTGLAAAILGVGVREVIADGHLLGRFLEAFVAAQLRPELEALDVPARLHHLRDRDGREVDLVLDLGRRGMVAIEVKATAAPTARDARHLRWLRGELGPAVLAAVVLHTGTYNGPLGGDDVRAAPIASLWA